MITGGAFYGPGYRNECTEEDKITSPHTKMSLFLIYFPSAFNQSNTFLPHL